ncbi:MAG TPA: menaquinone biosynthesis decarboxylase, partial [Polyangia bacterium]
AWLGKATERLFLPLLQMTFPEIVDMNLPIEGVFHNLCIVSIKKEYPHHARKICHSLWGMGQMMFAKCIIVVDDDVNVQNVREVAWRALNNIDAKRDVFFAEGPIDVLDHASAAFGFGGKLGVDATRKWKEEGFTREWPDVLKMDPAVDARAAALLKELGL